MNYQNDPNSGMQIYKREALFCLIVGRLVLGIIWVATNNPHFEAWIVVSDGLLALLLFIWTK